MGEETEGEGVARRFVSAARNGSVLVGLAAAALGLAFNWNAEQRRVAELNLQAMRVAEERLAAFETDPHNTVAWLEAGFPRHAYCAGLTVFIARSARVGGGTDVSAVRNMSDAVGLEIDRIGADAGLSAREIEDAGFEEGARLAQSERPGACGEAVAVGALDRLLMPDECARVLGAYRKNSCFRAWREASEALVRAEMAAPETPPILSMAPAPPEEEGPCADPAERPEVFLHIVEPGDRAAANEIVEILSQRGWRFPGVELVEGAATRGDVRFYHEDQRACAGRLAEAVREALPPTPRAEALRERGLALISLENRYRNLPRGRVEVWLPDL
jgi:hypothetical protein